MNITTEFNKQNNDIADTFANKGSTEGFEVGVKELATFFRKQREELLVFMVRLQKAMIRSLTAEKLRREEDDQAAKLVEKANFGKEAGKITIPATLPFANGGDHEAENEVNIPAELGID